MYADIKTQKMPFLHEKKEFFKHFFLSLLPFYQFAYMCLYKKVDKKQLNPTSVHSHQKRILVMGTFLENFVKILMGVVFLAELAGPVS